MPSQEGSGSNGRCLSSAQPLLIAASYEFRRDGCDKTKESLAAMIRTRGKVHLRCWSPGGVVIGCAGAGIRARVAEADAPNAINRQRIPAGILQHANEASRRQIVGGNPATGFGHASAGELGDQQVVTIGAEVERRKGDAPRRIEPVPMLQAKQQTSGCRINIHTAESR